MYNFNSVYKFQYSRTETPYCQLFEVVAIATALLAAMFLVIILLEYPDKLYKRNDIPLLTLNDGSGEDQTRLLGQQTVTYPGTPSVLQPGARIDQPTNMSSAAAAVNGHTPEQGASG